MTPILPSINAALNATAAVLLVWGYTLIRRKQIQRHRKVMTAAFVTSCLFLVCYIVYHIQVGSVRFQHTGALRTVYLSILTTHTILAANRAGAGDYHASPGPGGPLRQASPDRPLDLAHLALRECHRGGSLFNAVPPVARAFLPVLVSGEFCYFGAPRGAYGSVGFIRRFAVCIQRR